MEKFVSRLECFKTRILPVKSWVENGLEKKEENRSKRDSLPVRHHALASEGVRLPEVVEREGGGGGGSEGGVVGRVVSERRPRPRAVPHEARSSSASAVDAATTTVGHLVTKLCRRKSRGEAPAGCGGAQEGESWGAVGGGRGAVRARGRGGEGGGVQAGIGVGDWTQIGVEVNG